MTAVDKNGEAIEALARGGSVSVIEAAKDAAYKLGETIDTQAQQTSPDQVVEAASEGAEELLGVLFPMIEYGDERAVQAIPRILLHVGGRTSAALQEIGAHRVGGVVVLARIFQ